MKNVHKYIAGVVRFFTNLLRQIAQIIISFFVPLTVLFIAGSTGFIAWALYHFISCPDDANIQTVIHIAGALASFSAVLVALFKESILRFIHGPRFEIIEPAEGVSLKEVTKDHNTKEVISLYYDVGVKNAGGGVATDCTIEPCEIKYRANQGNNFHSKKRNTAFSEITWKSENKDLSSGVTREVRLFEIKPPSKSEYPNGEGAQERCKLSIWGCRITGIEIRKGEWEITYFIASKNGVQKKFRLNINWNGEFCSNTNDISDCITVNLREI